MVSKFTAKVHNEKKEMGCNTMWKIPLGSSHGVIVWSDWVPYISGIVAQLSITWQINIQHMAHYFLSFLKILPEEHFSPPKKSCFLLGRAWNFSAFSYTWQPIHQQMIGIIFTLTLQQGNPITKNMKMNQSKNEYTSHKHTHTHAYIYINNWQTPSTVDSVLMPT